jgi:hypothetical protein
LRFVFSATAFSSSRLLREEFELAAGTLTLH